jgi:hypothetical protein
VIIVVRAPETDELARRIQLAVHETADRGKTFLTL